MKSAKVLLELCKHRFPSSRPHQAHNLTLKDGKMVLTLMLGDTCQAFNLDEGDLERDPVQLVSEMARLLKKPKAAVPDETA